MRLLKRTGIPPLVFFLVIPLILLWGKGPVSSQSFFLLPKEEGRIGVVMEGLEPSFINYYLIHPHGQRETIFPKEGVIEFLQEIPGDYRFYGEYISREIIYRSKVIFSSKGQERRFREASKGAFLEILPLSPPEEMTKDSHFTGQVVYQGVALGGVPVNIIDPRGETSLYESDVQGFFQIPLKGSGLYLMRGHFGKAPLLLTSFTLEVFDDTQRRVFHHYRILLFCLILFFLFLIKYLKRI